MSTKCAVDQELSYLCVEAESPGELQESVNKAINKGWRPLGAPVAWCQYHNRFMQAMIYDPTQIMRKPGTP